MPFTFAHPAIVLPLSKWRRVSFTALVFGSMSPDFEYFLRMRSFSIYSHTMPGLLLFDLPLALILSVLFHAIVKKPMVASLPAWFHRGLHCFAQTSWGLQSWSRLLVFAYSALLGSLTHVIWDAFTHKGAFAVSRWAILQQHFTIAGIDIPVYKLLQHGSSCIGLAAIAYVIAKTASANQDAKVDAVFSTAGKWLYWCAVGVCGILFACCHSLATKGILPFANLLASVVSFLSGSMVGLVIVSWWAGRFVMKK